MATLSTNDIKIRYVVEADNLTAATNAFDKLTEEEKQALAELKKYNAETKNTNSSLSNIGSVAGKVGAAIGGAFAVSKIIEFGKVIIDTTIKFESFRKAIEFASGSVEAGAKNFEYLTDLANRLGLDLTSTVDAYKSFAAASRLAGQSQQETNRQFEAVAKAAQVMGLSAEDTKGALGALGQMLSKGTVQAEELRGQLGERLVGSFSLAAKAMGVTTQELGKMLEGGKVMAVDLLPKFATELENTFGKGNVQVNTLAASQNRFNSSMDKLILAIGNRLNPFLKGAYDLAAGIASSIGKAAGGEGAKKASAESIAARRVEAELAKAVFDLDQTNSVRITKSNIEQIRSKLAVQKLLDLEIQKDKNLGQQAEARVAKDNAKLKKLEGEYKILEEMEVLYTNISAVVANAPKPPPPIDPKAAKEAQKFEEEQYQRKLKLLQLEKEFLTLQAQLRGEGAEGAEKVFAEKVYQLKKQYLGRIKDLNAQEVENAKLTSKVKAKDFEDASRKELLTTKQAKIEIATEDDKLYDKRLANMKKWQKDYEKGLEDEVKAQKQAEERKEAIRNKAFELGQTLVQGGFDIYQAQLNNEMSSLQKRYDEEIRLADGNKQKITEINERKAAAEKEIRTKQFRAQQASSIAQILFTLGEQLMTYGVNPATAPLAILAGTIAAAQIGIIAATPVPEFAEGTKGKPFKGGKAIVGERGVEKVITESGKVYFTPPTATLVDLPKGAQVIPNHALSKQELFLAGHYANRSNSTASPVVGEIRELGSIIRSLPITQLNMDERGFEKYIRTPRRTTKVLNNRFRSSES